MKKKLLNRKKLTVLFYSLSLMLIGINVCVGQTVSPLPIYEGFNYPTGSTIFPSATAAANTNGLGQWSTPSTLTKDGTLIVASPTWTTTGLSQPFLGNALQILGSGADPEIRYTPLTAGFGAVYSSFLVSVTSQANATLQPTGIGGYFYGMSSGTLKRALVYLRMTATSTFQLGISSSTAGSGIDWCTTTFLVNDKIFVVIKYTEAGLSSMFVNPVISIEPVSGFQTSTETITGVLPDRILVNANNNANTPQIAIDEIKVANSWAGVTGTGDNIAPNSPGAVTVNNPTGTTLDVSWSSASGFVTGDGYMVVRYTSNPNANNDPSQQTVYAVGNTITNGTGSLTGTVVYVGTGTTLTDTGLTAGTSYYYKVYTFDTCRNYSVESSQSGSTSMPIPAAEPTTQATAIGFTNVTSSGFTINWTPGDGTKSLVIVKALSSVNADPVDGLIYTANTAFGSGAQLGTGNYTVFNGTGSSVTITGLSRALNYYVKVYTYNGASGTENYLITSPASNYQMTLPGEISSNGTGGGDWSVAATWNGNVVPTQYDNVTIVGNDVVNVNASTSSVGKCYNLSIASTAKFWAPTGKTIQIYGTSIACEGVFGDVSNVVTSGSQLTLEFGGNLTVSGSGSFYPWKIKPITGLSNIGVTFNANTQEITAGSGTAILSDNGSNDNVTYTISTGKTLKVYANWSMASSTGTNGNANTTINILGTCIINTAFATPIAAGKTCTVNINGTLVGGTSCSPYSNLGGGITTFNVNGTFSVSNLNVTPITAGIVAPVINVGSAGVITVNGIADFANTSVIGFIGNTSSTSGGSFNLSAGATIKTAASLGLEPISGSIRTTTRNFSTEANYYFVGSASQVTGGDLPDTINNLTIDNTNGVTLGSSKTVNGILNIISGKLFTGSNFATIGTLGSTSGTGWVVGNLTKQTASGSSPTFLYAIGDATEYTPISLTFNGTNTASVTGSITASAASGDHAAIATSGLDSTKNVNRIWTLINTGVTGFTNYDATFTYANADNDGIASPANYVVRRYENSVWSSTTASGTSTSSNTSVSGITSFGDFTIGETTGLPSFATQPTNSTICSGSDVTFTATSNTNLPSNIKWQRSIDGISWLDITANLDSGTVYSGFATGTLTLTGSNNTINNYQYKAVCTTINGSSDSNVGALNVVTTNAPLASDQSFCASGSVGDLTATGSSLNWFSVATNGTPLASTDALISGTYYVSQTENSCESSRTSFLVTVNSQPAQPTTACYETATYNSATCSWVVTGSQPVQPSIDCYESATFNSATCSWNVTGTQPVQPSTACYESATFNTASCSWNVTGSQPVQPSIACYESVTFNANTCLWDVSGTPISAPTGATTQSLNAGQTVADLVVVGNNIVWYSSSADALSNTNPLALTTVLISGNTYYAMQTINGCSSATPLAVVVTINLANADFDLVGLEFYPNPVKDILHVSFNQKINSVAIYNLIGQLINFNKPNTTSAEIDMSALPQGPYILQIESDGKHKAIKIIKK